MNAKIELVISIYDIAGEERVIQKKIIGGTGTAMFVLVDDTAEMIEKAVNKYTAMRQKHLAEAKREREESERLNAEERERLLKERLERAAFRARLNNSLYLDTHVALPKTMKILYFLMYSQGTQERGIYISTFQNLLSQLNLSYGIFNNFEVRLELAVLHNTNADFGSSGTVNVKKQYLYNPNILFKYRVLQNENHGVNLAVEFGIQFSYGDKLFGGNIFLPQRNSGGTTVQFNSHNFTFNVYADKTFGIFTPYLGISFRIKKYTGTLLGLGDSSSEYEAHSGLQLNKSRDWDFEMKAGFEVRPLKWLVLQPGIRFFYVPSISIVEGPLILGSIKQISFGLNLIFILPKRISLAIAFQRLNIWPRYIQYSV
mgnify:FL=1